MQFQKVTLAGVGLLGGSLGLALKKTALAKRVDGLVRRSQSIQECARLGVVDQATRDPLQAAADADLIILCTPLSSMQAVVQSMLPALQPGVVVTDVGSVKTPVVQELEPLLASVGAHFVGSHPMAGNEQQGPAASRANLFEQAICVVTPTANTPPHALRSIRKLWKTVGGVPLQMRPDIHDDLVGRSSHLPHIVAAELAGYVLSPLHRKEQRLLCATGFRDTTRIASGSPQVWRDIALANRENLARVLGVFIEGLEEVRHALKTNDADGLLEFLQKARERRDAWTARRHSSAAE